jgi:thiol:disulfide interchange protein
LSFALLLLLGWWLLELLLIAHWTAAIAGALVTVAAIWASSMWLHQQRQRQRQVDRERQLHAAAQAPVGAAVPGGGMPAICVHVSKTGALQNVVLGEAAAVLSCGCRFSGQHQQVLTPH